MQHARSKKIDKSQATPHVLMQPIETRIEATCYQANVLVHDEDAIEKVKNEEMRSRKGPQPLS
jgi:hypothetical protein